jgi:hypothetical protein
MIDVSCGSGGATTLVADCLGIPEAYGVEIDDERIPAEE